ncbi:protein FAM166B-like [Orussus abietinus]|uniref:protein FAM166B-like n=1 Tax=Orussus abietinus TaxID=222816 RepID=UPI0006260F1B|nr:protein FAM166B-like [Orussus abietinus]
MVFDPVTDEQRKAFFRQGYGAHVPGYTGHCPTLKFRVGKRFGACTGEIAKELLEKRILKTGPYRPAADDDALALMPLDRDARKEKDPLIVRERKFPLESYPYDTPPYILGYTGYIPGFSNRYGLPFRRAVEEGGREWRETQCRLRTRRDTMKIRAEKSDPGNLLARARADNVDVEIDHGHQRERTFFESQVSPEYPPIVGYTGHIPGARSEVALSKRYAQAAKKGLEIVRREREVRFGIRPRDSETVQRVLDVADLDDEGGPRP